MSRQPALGRISQQLGPQEGIGLGAHKTRAPLSVTMWGSHCGNGVAQPGDPLANVPSVQAVMACLL